MGNTLLQKSICVLMLLFFQSVLAQLTDFTLNVTATNETCTGNGTLTFAVTNATPGSNIVYTIYLLPNTATPLASTSLTTLGGLSAGNYRIVATQTLGNQSNSEQQDVVITTTIEDLAYQLSGTITCNDGTITVNVTAGNPVQYQILSGPVTRPLQPSNVFTMLPPGVYVVRVVDACGDALVQTYTLLNLQSNYQVASVSAPDCPLIDCNTVNIETVLNALGSSVINYPILVEYVIHPPTGPAINVSQTVESGAPITVTAETALPFYDQPYTIDVKITDACGNVTIRNANPLDMDMQVTLQSAADLCDNNIKIEACHFVPPFTVNFISTPAGFNPSAFNGQHPGPFQIPILYVSNGTNVMPPGNYTIQLTDGCGRTAVDTIQLEESNEPKYTMLPQGCGFGQIGMPGQNGSPVQQVIITAAPAAYGQPLPDDVSENINAGQFLMSQLPAGTYTFTVVSVCDETYQYTITIPPSAQQPVLINYLRGCEVGMGSINMAVQQTNLVIARIVSAPAAFPQTLPYDISFNIADGQLYINSLPMGIYSFYLKDQCGGERTITIDIPGYQQTSIVDVMANCGSFNLFVDHTPNETYPHSYFLQRFNAATGNWEHPLTGHQYIEGAEPDPLNSIPLENHALNLNFAVVGTFRVVKFHKVYSNGQSALSFCVTPIKEFEFTGGPSIIDAFALPCATNPGQVTIVAEGLPPLRYYITTRNGQPFYVDNGENPTFSGLTPAIYNFQVRDVCENIVNRLFDLGSIPPPNITQSVLCDGQNGQLSVEGFDFLNYQWWNAGNPGVILSTTNVLDFSPFSSATHTGTYVVRIYSGQSEICTDQTVSYTIPAAGNNLQAGEGTVSSICGSSQTVDLFDLLDGNFSTAGNWMELTNSGMQIGHSWLPVDIPFGTYQFQYTVDGLCGTSDVANVTIHFNQIPPTPTASSSPFPICSSGTILLSANDIPGATYSWTGPNGFTSSQQNPVIENATPLNSGDYSVTASIGDCQSEAGQVSITVEPMPEFVLTAGCNANQYAVAAVSADDAFDPSVTFSWTGPDNFTASTNPIVITGGKKGVYEVTVETANGCSVTQSVEVLNTACAIPTGISPNTDGKNETFDLTGFDVLRFKVFSRYGNIVFEQNDYTNQWHGQDKNGRQLPDATYYYYIKLKTGEERTGWVYVTQ